ncbi:hypothetical protein A2W39_02880 [Candidatus Azambacteria bacterium RIFCSPHIGHO2_01_46_10]|nr:MAG: hypothetical protein A2W60_00190 [Candidatus Azambacteria bacterium RIFCSPHIGHO2_02_46_12]OGD35926.1 MAG: hypothetical protein A2W39_02880 [Candidatus Azambacteria bacterium RIFCSPHIGHO2_01_46_10]HAM95871.1 hypothetical protein [Candidatus Azambacteria bacterium]
MEMKDVIKKSILLGMGLLSYTDKEIEKAIHALEKSKHIKAGEGEELIKDIAGQIKKKRRETTAFINKQALKAVREARVATQKGLSQLEKKLSKK